MRQYRDLVQHVLDTGTRKENRTGVDTISTFNYNFEHDFREGFPLLTTKSVSWKNIVIEMLWFLSGQTDIAILKRHGCKFWDAWADDQGKVPSAYGNFWRQFPVHKLVDKESGGSAEFPLHLWTELQTDYNDQIAWVLEELKRNPMSRRMVVSAWAPGNAQTSKLPPCHMAFVLNVQNEDRSKNRVCYGHNYGKDAICGGKQGQPILPHGEGFQPWMSWCEDCNGHPMVKGRLSESQLPLTDPKRLCLHLTQRSCDVALGVPYNIASYGLLLSLFSHFSGIEVGIFAHTLVDAHIYTAKPDGSMADFDHIPGLKTQIARKPGKLPKLIIDPTIRDLKDIEALMDPKLTTDEVMGHFHLDNYDPFPAINFKVAV